MRYAVLSDIHGNSHALKSVLKNIEKECIDGYFCAGDYYGDFPYPNEVIDMIRNLKKSYVVSGNKEEYLMDLHASDPKDWVHDQFNALYWNYNELREDNIDYLLKLPNKMTIKVDGGKEVLLLHNITNLFKETKLDLLTCSKYAERMDEEPFEHEDYLENIENLLLSDEKFLKELECIGADIIVFGHTHVQWHVTINNKVLINAGSSGLPLDYRSGATYTILDIEGEKITVEEQRIEYDKNSLIEEYKQSTLYESAKYWCDIILSELISARDDITFFFKHAWELAKRYEKDTWPLDNTIWDEAAKSWFEGR